MRKVLIGAAAVLGVLVVLMVTGLLLGDGDEEPGTEVRQEGEVSTEAAAAGCLPVERAKLPEKQAFKHVNGEVDYPEQPPNHGDHSANTLRNAKRFYSREDNPSAEQAVHNLEHGLVVAWYDDELGDDQVRVLADVSQGISTRYVAVPWRRSVFEDDRHFVLTAWGVTQRCRTVSPEVITQFVNDHADTNAPEKGYSV